MQLRAFKLRFRRRIRLRQHQVEDFGQQAEVQLEKHFYARLNKFGSIWRFVTLWVLLFGLLIGCLIAQIEALSKQYQTLQPVPGGIYTEGVEGTFTNASPLYATSEVDTTVSRLIFAGLLRYDDHNQLVGDLAESWTVNAKGTVYTVHLRPGLSWQDGHPIDANDVVYTYQAIQNPDAESPLRSGWEGIDVAAVDSRTVSFTLPNPLSSFAYSLTGGIVPKHLLGSIPMGQLRSAAFNTTAPVGAGPFQWSAIAVEGSKPEVAEQQISLVPFEHYWRGAAKLKTFNVHAFASREAMIAAYKDQEITAMVSLGNALAGVTVDKDSQVYTFPLTAATMTFFKTSSGVLSDTKVRQALVSGSNPAAIIKQLTYPARPVRGPLLNGQIGNDPAYAQVTNKPAEAKAALDAAGWVVGKNGVRSKAGQPLTFELYATNTPEYSLVTRLLRQQWGVLGVDVKVRLQDPTDFQNTLTSHSYDAVLYGISIGVDPDVFAYWDSSQSDVRSANRLNLSEYKSTVADDALEAGRTRVGDALRVIKYKPFLKAWQQDAPALGLYQARLLYASNLPIFGLQEHQINSDSDRFSNVSNWMIRQALVTNQ